MLLTVNPPYLITWIYHGCADMYGLTTPELDKYPYLTPVNV